MIRGDREEEWANCSLKKRVESAAGHKGDDRIV